MSAKNSDKGGIQGKVIKEDFDKLFKLMNINVTNNIFADSAQLANLQPDQIRKNFIDTFFKNYDKNKNGTIEFEELTHLANDVAAAVGRTISNGKHSHFL